MFIFLNKTCFRGIFRVGPNGFNVPYGHYKNPTIINKLHLQKLHILFKNVIFKCLDFTDSLKMVKYDDFLYLDPPYVQETNTSFVKYTNTGFSLCNHLSLFKILHGINSNNIKYIMNNANVPLVRDEFKNSKYIVKTITSNRLINSKNPNQRVKELIIKNF
jgi:DNA adenine methylase